MHGYFPLAIRENTEYGLPNSRGRGERLATTTPTLRRLEVEWAKDWRGREPARDFFNKIAREERRELENAIRHLQEVGVGINHQKFKRLNHELFELKGHQSRLIGSFRPGGRFVVAHGVLKKKDDHNQSDFVIAMRILKQHDLALRSSATILPVLKPNPSFKSKLPTLTIVPPAPAPKIAPTPEFTLRSADEYAWAYVKTSDLLPPDCPLMMSMTRLPHLHQSVVKDELRSFVEARLKAMSIDMRIATGLLDDNTLHLQLGALWAVEFMQSRLLDEKNIALPETAANAEIVEAAPEPAPPEPTIEPEPPVDIKLYWLRTKKEGGQPRRWLAQITREPKRLSIMFGPPKVFARVFFEKTRRWSNENIYPVSRFKDLASLKDPFVREAVARREDAVK